MGGEEIGLSELPLLIIRVFPADGQGEASNAGQEEFPYVGDQGNAKEDAADPDEHMDGVPEGHLSVIPFGGGVDVRIVNDGGQGSKEQAEGDFDEDGFPVHRVLLIDLLYRG